MTKAGCAGFRLWQLQILQLYLKEEMLEGVRGIIKTEMTSVNEDISKLKTDVKSVEK